MNSPFFRIRLHRWVICVMLIATALAIGVIVTLIVFPRERSQQQSALGSSRLVGKQAPDFTLTALNGAKVSLSQFRGKPVLINFWASWCIPCREETPDLVKAYKTHHADELIILGLNLTSEDTLPDIKAFVEEFQMPYPVLLDQEGKVMSLYHVQGIPTSVFINRQGVITYIQIGKLTAEQIDKYLAEILPDSK